ncbi:MAG TPA: YdbL family protein [Thauera sp.]|nr:YdbL family protein [Thauera sp.]HRA81580.1 YdbL family protein [Thauera sp.]
MSSIKIPRRWLAGLLLGCLLAFAAQAQGNLEVDTPAISALKASMQQRHRQLAPLYASGAVGLAADGSIALRDASLVSLAQRGGINALVAAENADRSALYREIARANQHPEWEPEVRNTFAQRWIDRAQAGWWVQRGAAWTKK